MDAVLILVVFAIALLVPFAIAKLWWWFWFWVAIGATLGITEALSFFITGKTISQKFWAWRKTAPKWQKVWIFIGMIGFWAFLMIHLFFQG